MRLRKEDDEKEIRMKDHSCREGHQFNEDEIKNSFKGWPLCPHCWPNGLMRPKNPAACKAALQRE